MSQTVTWIDTHCHVSSAKFAEDLEETLARAEAANISQLIDIGCDVEAWEPSLRLTEKHDHIFCSLGLHPHEAKHWNPESKAQLIEHLSHPKVCAIGEMGLDYYYNLSSEEQQVRAFHEQLELAEELDLPAVFHIRDAHQQAAEILDSHPNVRGIVHCFTGNWEQAQRYLEQGHFISFSGIVTFKKATDIQEAARNVPNDKILVETDSPYLAPVPKRGKRNEPAFVAHTAAFVAEIRNTPALQFSEITRRNTMKAFRFLDQPKV